MAERSSEAGKREGQKGGARRAGDASYVLPRHPSELDRLDVQHYALREALHANYVAPVVKPARVLDVGSGSGQWAYDLCEEFPEAVVVGLDLQPSSPPWPANYRFVRNNLLQGLPFTDGRFDFVHQRLLFSGIPVKSWAVIVQDLLRVTRPGGWIELVEGAPWIDQAGPATGRLIELLVHSARALGLDSTGIVFRSLDTYLSRAGAIDVRTRPLVVPIGDRAGSVGSLMATNYRAMFTRLSPVFTAKLGIPEQECRDLIATMQEEWDRYESTFPMTLAIGRRTEQRL